MRGFWNAGDDLAVTEAIVAYSGLEGSRSTRGSRHSACTKRCGGWEIERRPILTGSHAW